MSGAPLDVLGSQLAQGPPRYPGGTSACCRWGVFFGAYGRNRLITMPWGVDVAQRGTHYVVESCKDRYFPIASIMPMCFTDFASHDQ